MTIQQTTQINNLVEKLRLEKTCIFTLNHIIASSLADSDPLRQKVATAMNSLIDEQIQRIEQVMTHSACLYKMGENIDILEEISGIIRIVDHAFMNLADEEQKASFNTIIMPLCRNLENIIDSCRKLKEEVQPYSFKVTGGAE